MPKLPHTEVLIVGSGPGGATLARELARAGRQVLLLERGHDQRQRRSYGTYLGALRYADRGSLLFSREGVNIIRPLMLGGATSMYCGCAAGPPAWLKDRYGIDINHEVALTIGELGIAPLPPELRGAASTRLAEAAGALGYTWQPEAKFMRVCRTEDGRVGEWETRDRRPETGDRRPETGDRRQETGDKRPETGDKRPETGDKGNQSPIPNPQSPIPNPRGNLQSTICNLQLPNPRGNLQSTICNLQSEAGFGCGAHCMLGCRCGAKWNAAEYVDQAVAAGARVLTGARVSQVLTAGRRAVGVAGWCGGTPFVATADMVVLAAGGIGTPRILQASGIAGAGQGMTIDTTVMVYGVTKAAGNGREPPMTWYWRDEAAGFMLSALIDPWLLYPLIMALKGWPYPLRWPQWGRTLGIMIKLSDEVSGGVFADGSISKGLTANDAERLALAETLARRILREAGADPQSFVTTPLRGTHPGSTVRIGDLLDHNLQTELAGLYVCDASSFPAALGRPTVLTIIGLAKRLAHHLVTS